MKKTPFYFLSSIDKWEEMFSSAYSVDFFQSSVANTRKILRPKFYGKKMPAYAALGSTRCPIAFYSERTF